MRNLFLLGAVATISWRRTGQSVAPYAACSLAFLAAGCEQSPPAVPERPATIAPATDAAPIGQPVLEPVKPPKPNGSGSERGKAAPQIDVVKAMWARFEPERPSEVPMEGFPPPEAPSPEVIRDCRTHTDCGMFFRQLDGPSACCADCDGVATSVEWAKAADGYCAAQSDHCEEARCGGDRAFAMCSENACRRVEAIDQRFGQIDFICNTDADCTRVPFTLGGASTCCSTEHGMIASKEFASRVERTCRGHEDCLRPDSKMNRRSAIIPMIPACIERVCMPAKDRDVRIK